MPKLIAFNLTHDCPKCNNTGYILDERDPFKNTVIRCECQVTKRIISQIKNSGLSSQFINHTFDAFETKEPFQRNMKNTALEFLDKIEETDDEYGKHWIVFSGQYGSGKTFIAEALSGQLVLRGKTFYYLPYVSVIPKLAKDLLNFDVDIKQQAERDLERIKSVEVLYIDDFLKTLGKNDLIWEIIDYRYKRHDLMTIISTELFYDELKRMDGAFASRIYQRTAYGKYFVEIEKNSSRNYREKTNRV